MRWTDGQEKEFGLLLLAMGELLNEPVSSVRAELYCRAVEDLPFERVRAAAQQLARTSKFFPKPAELREIVESTGEDRAEIAWAHVLKEVRRVGWTGTPTWPDAATKRAAMQMFGGWRALCENLPSTGPELLGHAKQFKAFFAAFATQDSRALAEGDTGDVPLLH